MDWEDTKENFVPVKQGHSTAALSTPLSVTQRSRELEEAKRTFLEAIKTASDPLAAWQKYIKWTQEQFATQGTKAELQQVLEAATKALSGTKRYNDDVRFLRIFVQYADCLPDPSDVFLHLENQGIGRDHALLYEAYATYLELKGSFQQAGLVYQEGINRLAKPLERLKQKHAGFQQRMEKRLQRHTSEVQLGMDTAAADSSNRATLAPVLAPLGPPQLDENGNPIRPSRQQGHERLARLPPQAGSVAAGIRPAAGNSARPSLFGGCSSNSVVAPQAAGGLFGMAQTTSSRASLGPLPVPIATTAAAVNGAKSFDVLVDDEFGPSGRGALPTAFPAGQNPHRHLPGYKTGRKENTTDAGQWGGQKLKQQAVYTAPTASKLEVYEDEDLAEQHDAATAPHHQQQQASLRQQLDGDGLHRDPLPAADDKVPGHSVASKVPGTSGVEQLAVLQQPTAVPATGSNSASSRSSSNSISAASAPAAAATAVPQGYNAALLVAADGSELSFEEVRAVAWRAKRAQQLQQEEEQRKRIKLQQQEQLERIKLQEEEQQQRECTKLQQEEEQRELTRRLQEEEQQRERVKLQQEEEQRKRIKVQQQEQLERIKLQQAEEQQRLELQAQQQREEQQRLEQLEQQQLERQELEKERQQLALQRQEQERQKQQLELERQQLEQQKQEQQQREQQRMKEQQMLLAQQRQQQQPAGYSAAEPTVTVNTRAALESMNFMFSQDLPTMTLSRNAMASAAAAGRGYPEAGMRAPRPAGGLGDEATVTVNTRAAMDAMNGMFGCGDDTTTMHGFGVPRGGMDRSIRASAAEPTVTINTRQAFDYMNDMFGDKTGQQTMTGRQPARGGPKGGHSRLSMAASGRGWQLHEDTELLQNTKGLAGHRQAGIPPADNATGGQSCWELREDTEFVGTAGRQASTGLGGRLDICEDTEFLTRTVAGAGAGGQFSVYEDTDYLSVPVANVTAGLNRLSLANRSSGFGSSGGPQDGLGMGLHEDTSLLTANTGAAVSLARSAAAGNRAPAAGTRNGSDPAAWDMGLHEDTELLTGNVAAGSNRVPRQAGRLGGNRHAAAGPQLGLHEDTELLTGHAAAPAKGFCRQGSSSSRESSAANASKDADNAARGLQIHEDTELLTGHAAAHAAAAACNRAHSSNSRDTTASAHSTDPENMPAGRMALGLHEDTELLSGPDSAAQGSNFSSNSTKMGMQEEASDTTTGLLRIKENLPAPAVPRGPRAPFGSSAATAATVGGAVGARSSRLGHSSAPGSPVGHCGPAWASTTPGKPPMGSMTPSRYGGSTSATPNRGPNTPGTPWARPMDEFEVMESPAVREAMAGRPALQMSPAASLPSPGLGHLENLPRDENAGAHIRPRDVHDRSSRAAALQPLSKSRAELLGVEIEPTQETGDCDDEGHESSACAAGPQAVRADGKPSALRSLRFQG